jgi:trehalose 2-sulfotransferase
MPEITNAYVVCATPRSGSNLLCDLLSKTRIAGTPMEYWNATYRDYFLKRWGRKGGATDSEYLQLALRAGKTGNGLFSAKIHWYQLEQLSAAFPEPADLPFFTAVPQLHYVFLTRADKLRQAISWYRASHTNKWSSVEARAGNGASPPSPPFCYDSIRRGIDILQQHERAWLDFFDRSGIQPLSLEYSKLCADVVRATRRVLSFIGVAQALTAPIRHSRLEKQRDLMTENWAHAWITESRRNRIHSDSAYGPDWQDGRPL